MAELRYQNPAPTRARTQAEIDQGLRSYMLGVYNYMASGLAVTGAVAAGTFMLAVQNGQLTPFGLTLFQSPLMWVFVLAPAVMAEGAEPGVLMVFMPRSPSFPAGTTTAIPPAAAFSTAAAQGSHGKVPELPQAAPCSCSDQSAGNPTETEATSIPSLKASSRACSTTSEKVKSFTPGDPKIL